MITIHKQEYSEIELLIINTINNGFADLMGQFLLLNEQRNNKLIKQSELAVMLNVNYQTIREWRLKKKLLSFESNHNVIFRFSDVIEAILEGKIIPKGFNLNLRKTKKQFSNKKRKP